MEVHEASGNPAEALRSFDELRQRLRDELGAAPGPAVMAVHQRLLRGDGPPRTPRRRRSGPPPGRCRPRSRPRPSARSSGGRGAWRRSRRRGNGRVGGERGCVLVAGEPGIGKTRLAAELCRRAHADGATVLLGRSTEEALTPYQPFVEALRHYAASSPADELALQAGTGRDVLARLVPELAAGAAEPPPADPGGDGERYALFDAVAALPARGSPADGRIILVLDDLQWADAPALLLLRQLARAWGPRPCSCSAPTASSRCARTIRWPAPSPSCAAPACSST